MEEKKLSYRMYFFVLYNLSPIEQGIQAGHAALEYAMKYKNQKELQDFVFHDKTWILLDGGTSNNTHQGHPKGSMEELSDYICDLGIPYASFCEPNMNMAMTAICFLVDERVWNDETYPDFLDFSIKKMYPNENDPIPTGNLLMLKAKTSEELETMFPEYHNEWIKSLGGKSNVYLRELLKDQILA